MECSCQVDTAYDDGGSASFMNERSRRARTTHKCSECHRVINVGELYSYVSGLWEGHFSVAKTCTDCLSLRNEFFSSYTFECIWSDLEEHIDACGGVIPEDCLLHLTPVAKAKVADMIEKYFERVEAYNKSKEGVV